MTRLRYRSLALAFTVLLGAVSLASEGRHSLSASMFASALAKFRHVKSPQRATGPVVATVATTAVRDDTPFTLNPPPVKVISNPTKDSVPSDPPKDASTAKVTPEVTTKKDIPVPIDLQQGKTTQKPDLTPGNVTNLFTDTPIKDVMNEVASMAGVTIVADETVKNDLNVSVEFKNDPIDNVVARLALMAGAYWKKDAPGFYIISKATPEASLFRKFAETKMYIPHNQQAASIQAVLSPSYKLYVSVDAKTNQIGVSAPRELMEKILGDIEQADRPGRQVVVEALITEMNVQDSLNSGFSWSAGNFSLGTDLSLNYQVAASSDLVKINAAIEKQKATLRANPRLMTIEGRESTVNIGQDTYFSLLSGSTTFPTTQIQLIHTGVILKFTALIGDDGYITMYLAPEVSDAVVLTNGNPSSKVRRSDQVVRVKSGQTIVIAGLIQESSSRAVTKVPLLGYIPLIGEIFTQRAYTKQKIETIILVTPKLVSDGHM